MQDKSAKIYPYNRIIKYESNYNKIDFISFQFFLDNLHITPYNKHQQGRCK